METRLRVFDAHFHVRTWGQGDYHGYRIQPLIREHRDFRDRKNYLESHGIERGLVVPTYLKNQEITFTYNQLIYECVENVESLLGGLWVSPLPEVMTLTRKAVENISSPKIKVLKISSKTWESSSFDPDSWDGKFRENIEYILNEAATRDLTLQMHTGSGNADPVKLDQFMKVYGKRGRYHLVHMGESTGEIMKFVPRFVDWIEKGYDVYTDQVAAPTFGLTWLIRELERRNAGFERIVFGTDSPWSSFESEYWKIEGLETSGKTKDMILFGNASSLYDS